MADQDRVVRELRDACDVFGPTAPGLPILRWGLLLAALDQSIHDEYVVGMELIYEGYLVHYREGRVSETMAADRETSLLAGDALYARGLNLIAVRGDVGAVDLLARLMASCSALRTLSAPFSDDDALWSYAVGGLAALRHGATVTEVVGFFDELDAGLLVDGVDVRGLARTSAAALQLPSQSLLESELSGPVSPSAPPPFRVSAN